MLPEFLFTVGSSSMQEISRDDFSLMNGGTVAVAAASNGTEKDMCPTVQRHIPSPIIAGKSVTCADAVNHFDPPTLSHIKLEETSPVDLFPTHPTTWQQHPMNNHELAHHRLQPHHHGLNTQGCNKLLLQSSDDPLICHGANSVINDDDHPEFRTLIASAVAPETHHQHSHSQQQLQQQTQPSKEEIIVQQKMTQPTAPTPLPSQTTRRPQNGCSSLTKQQLKVKAGLMSAQNHIQASIVNAQKQHAQAKTKRKGALKLRFHHQALPAEYLSHYEATQGLPAGTVHAQSKETKTKERTQPVKLTQTAKLPPAKSAHENVRSWLRKIAEIQRSAQQHQHQQQQQQQQLPQQPEQHRRTSEQVSLVQADVNNNHKVYRIDSQSQLQSQSTPSPNAGAYLSKTPQSFIPPPFKTNSAKYDIATKPNQLPSPMKRVVNYSDLPYMGEMTLSNSKPRRGRKPKKTDICHLIYKNYGTIFPGTPKNVFNTQVASSDACAKIKSEQAGHLDEPLNLCVRDQSAELYSVSSGDDDDDDDDNDDDEDDIDNDHDHVGRSESTSNCATPILIPSDMVTDTLLAANLKMSLPSSLGDAEGLLDGRKQPKLEMDVETGRTSITAANVNDLLLQPVSMYYQKLLESGTLTQENGKVFGLPIQTIEKDNQIALKIPIPSGLFITPKLEKTSPPTPVNNAALDYPEPLSTPSSIKSENSITTTATTTSSATMQQHQLLAPQKRKRSAIFIPPVPAENTSNPATEVSICKFKFTGGAKPTLQEKKMLSVDSDGNYRYYNGTGDKSMRGYEFFPRESLQQSGLLPGVNCALLPGSSNGSSEKISVDIPPPSAGLSNELLQIPDSPTASILLPSSSAAPPTSPISPQTPQSPFSISPNFPRTPNGALNSKLNLTTNSALEIASTQRQLNHTDQRTASCERKRRSSRRSTQREKLEKTFKEKGFLIQTQQLESAEGATYCKFRQLKKFTRYLFRNWKDYLPGELQQANAAAAAAVAAAAAFNDHPNGDEASARNGTSTLEDQVDIHNLLATHGFHGTEQHLLRETMPANTTASKNVVLDNPTA